MWPTELWFLLKRCCKLAWFRAWFHLVPVGSITRSAWYLQHFRLVPVWFHLVPALRTMVLTASGLGSAWFQCRGTLWLLQHKGLVTLVSNAAEPLEPPNGRPKVHNVALWGLWGPLMWLGGSSLGFGLFGRHRKNSFSLCVFSLSVFSAPYLS